MKISKEHNHRGRILVVEDQGVVATEIQRCLEDDGYEVTAIATSMEEAIREAFRSRPDLVLMDIRIQGEADGIDVADHLHRHFALPIVYLSAHDDRDTMLRAHRTEPMAFLFKPFKPAELSRTVEIALNRSWVEVRDRERTFLSVMDAIGDAVVTTDSQGNVRFMNRAAEELTGWRQELALGVKATDVVHIVNEQETGAEGFCALLNVDGAPESDSDHEYRVLARDGVYHWVSIKAANIDGAGPSSIRVMVMQDVTRRRQSDQALRRQADLLDQSHEPIFTWDLDGAISYWNRGAQALYGFSPLEALGRAVGALLPAAHPSNDGAWETALGRDGQWSGELTRKTKDGQEIVVESLLVCVSDEAGRKTVLETGRDITSRKGAELEIRRLNQELREHVSELTAVNRELETFNYSIAHDLRAPLRHIDAYAKILLEHADAGLPKEAQNYLGRMRQSAGRMGCMVDELLELSRTSRRELARQGTALKSLLEDVLFELKSEVRDREIEWRIGELPFVDCDPTLTRQVFANLLANAVKFSRPRKLAVIEVGQTWDQGQMTLFVRDNGVGFSMKYADKLFEVFQRLHRREDFEGTGVGLATVQRIIHKHGGRIWVEAELEKGATFNFTLDSPAEPSRGPEREEIAVVAGAR
jgi:PAS domain S-box-containing protein